MVNGYIKKIARFLFPGFIFSMYILQCQAQVVNVESARMHSDTTCWMGGANVTANLAKSVTTVFGLNAEAHLQYKSDSAKNIYLVLVNYGYLKGGGIKYIANRFAHFRYNRKINSWLRGEAFTQIQSNLVTQIAERYLLGAGPRFKIVKSKKFMLYAASLAMYEYEKEATTPNVYHNDIRSSCYVSFSYTPHDNIEFVSTTYYQPLFRNFNDFRILNEVNATVKATKHFSVSLKWDYLYDQYPAGTAPRTNYTISGGIQFDI